MPPWPQHSLQWLPLVIVPLGKPCACWAGKPRESVCLPWAGCSAAPISSPLPLLRPFCPLRLWVRMPGVGQAPCDGNQRSSRVTPVSWDTETSDQPLHHWILLWCLPLFPGLLLPLSRFPVPFLSLKYPGTRCIPAACQGPQETSEDGR